MDNELKRLIPYLNGSVVGIGLEDDLIKKIKKNEKILEFDDIYLNKKNKGKINNKNIINKNVIEKKTIRVNIKKLRKMYNKKKVDYILCNYEVIKDYMRYFVKDSIYINNKKLYLYGTSIKEVETIKNKYKRYNVTIKETIKDYFILEINNENSKNNFIKDILYFIKDTISMILDKIGDFIIN